MKIVLKLLNCSVKMIKLCGFNPVQDGRFWTTHEWGSPKKAPLPKICHTYPTMMKLCTAIPYLKKIQTKFKSRDTPLEFC